jgi:hypothetical protein
MPPQGFARQKRRQKWQAIVVSVLPHIADLGSMFVAGIGIDYADMTTQGLRIPLPVGEYDVRYETAEFPGRRILAGLALIRRGTSMRGLDAVPIGRVQTNTGKLWVLDGVRKPSERAHAAATVVATASKTYPWRTKTPWAPFGRRGIVLETGVGPGAYDGWVARDEHGTIGMVLIDFTVSNDKPMLVLRDTKPS